MCYRSCLGSGHRAHACTMLRRALSPRHNPTVAVPASRHTVHATPFSPRRSSSQPRPTSPSPPTPEHHLSPSLAYDPICMVPSSSSESAHSLRPAERAVLGAPSAPPLVEMRISDDRVLAPVLEPPSPTLDAAAERRSPPPSPSPPCTSAPAPLGATHMLGLALVFAQLLLPSFACVASQQSPAFESDPATESSEPEFVAQAFSTPLPSAPFAPLPNLFPPPTSTRARKSLSRRPVRHSERLAAKADASFVDMTDKASQRKALLNSLSGCSAALQKQVNKRNILSHNKLPVAAADLRKLVKVAGLGCSKEAAVDDVVPSSNI